MRYFDHVPLFFKRVVNADTEFKNERNFFQKMTQEGSKEGNLERKMLLFGGSKGERGRNKMGRERAGSCKRKRKREEQNRE